MNGAAPLPRVLSKPRKRKRPPLDRWALAMLAVNGVAASTCLWGWLRWGELGLFIEAVGLLLNCYGFGYRLGRGRDVPWSPVPFYFTAAGFTLVAIGVAVTAL